MKAYIFDLDGTLFDSMSVWEDIDIKFLKKREIAVPDDYADVVLSMSLLEAADYTIKRFKLPDSIQSLIKEWNDMATHAYGNTVQMKSYAKEYLITLHKHGAKLVIATSLPVELYTPALRNHGIYDLFHAHCSTDEVHYGKSNPEIFLLAAKKLGVSPYDCIVFEDTIEAIKSAKSVGMTAYGVYDKASKAYWKQIKQIADGYFFNFKYAPLPKSK